MASRFEKAIEKEQIIGFALASERMGRGVLLNWWALKRYALKMLRLYGELVYSKRVSEDLEGFRISKAFQSCGESLLMGVTDVTLRQSATFEPYKMMNFMHCGGRTCPPCGHKLALCDVSECMRGVTEYAYEDDARKQPKAGKSVVQLCLTMSHTKTEFLRDVYADALKARKLFFADRTTRGVFESMGVEAMVVSTESPKGDNGWHVHPHAALFCNTPIDSEKRLQYESMLSPVWARMADKVGRKSINGIGLSLDGGESLKTYLGKLAYEAAYGNYGKDGGGRSHLRTPFSLLFDSAMLFYESRAIYGGIEKAPEGMRTKWLSDTADFLEWMFVLRGKRFFRWSPESKQIFPWLNDDDEKKLEDYENAGRDIIRILDARRITKELSAGELFSLSRFGIRNDVKGAVAFLDEHGYKAEVLTDKIGGWYKVAKDGTIAYDGD